MQIRPVAGRDLEADVRKGAEELGVPIEEHIAFCIAAMRDTADALGLRGTNAVGT